MDAEQWSAVLHLCDMWIHPELCAITIDKLKKLELSSIDRIVLARRHGIRQWLKPAFTTLCTRTEHLTAQEARELGIDIFIRVVKIREEYKVAAVKQQAQPPKFGYLTTPSSLLDRALDQMLDSEVMSD
ncbi:hypothetical protein FRC03_007989 [Tulasnella sp. 419]|nr:hypothetical protein FRC03_007989 [Tulasnella sp. 419]